MTSQRSAQARRVLNSGQVAGMAFASIRESNALPFLALVEAGTLLADADRTMRRRLCFLALSESLVVTKDPSYKMVNGDYGRPCRDGMQQIAVRPVPEHLLERFSCEDVKVATGKRVRS